MSKRRNNHDYAISAAQLAAFDRDGWVHLPGFLSRAETRQIERDCMRLIRREVPVEGRDFCDMTAGYDRPVEDFDIVNVMLPRRYLAALRDNVYERRALAAARSLLGEDMELDYDQLVAKPPAKPGAEFHWHQDQAYWPATQDTRTATFWLALDRTALDNGVVRFVNGSHAAASIRPHRPLLRDRDTNHTLVAAVDESREPIGWAALEPGCVTVHREHTVHGSAGNRSDRWRRGYVLAFRSQQTVAEERGMGFTHSHNDPPEVLAAIAAAARGRGG
jgi:phytanoyl-CoA hydroxylase